MPQTAIDVAWPIRGVSRHLSKAKQPQLTTADALNVRGYDPQSGRLRGARRCGLTRYANTQLSGSVPIQCLDHTVISSAFSGATSMVVRSLKRVAVGGGTVALFTSGGFSTATNGSSALSSTAPVIHSAELFGRVYFADGTNAKYWTASTNAVSSWSPSAGSLPSNGAHRPRLIAMWRSRLVLSGLVGDEHNWFMSAVGDPLDWDYSPSPTVSTQAVAGNNSNAGKVGDVVNAIIPCTAETLVFGCDHSIWVMFGDPAAGGRLTQLTDVTGMAWGVPWCKDPMGGIFFLGSRGGVYRMEGCSAHPERLTSDSIDEDLAEIDLTKTVARMAWNDREQGVHLFLTALDGSESTHWFLDVRNKAWWPDRFASENHNPASVHVFDGDLADDRRILLGCYDGYVREWDIDAEDDDGIEIDAYCWLGPLRPGKALQASILRELQATLAEDSGPLRFEVFSGRSAEQALALEIPASHGQWSAGRNPSTLQGARGDAVFVKVSGSCKPRWAFESLAARLDVLSPEGQRALVGGRR